jgi:HK97 family phage major capsid protein
MKQKRNFMRGWTAGERRKFSTNMREFGGNIQIGFTGFSLLRAVMPALLLLGVVGMAFATEAHGGGHGHHTGFMGVGLGTAVVQARELREQRGGIYKEMEKLIALPAMSPEQREQFNKMDADQQALKDRIDMIERTAAIGAEIVAGTRTENDPNPQAPGDAEKRAAHAAAFKNYLMRGEKELSPDDLKILREFRDMGTGGVGAYPGAAGTAGGFFVPVGFTNAIEQAMKWYGGMLESSTILPTDSGQVLPFPTSDDTAQVGELVGENQQVANQDVAVNQILFGAYKFSTKLVKVSMELLQDSAFNIDTFLQERFAERLGRVLNTYLTTGTGTNQPKGLVVAATAGINATGDDNQTTPDKLTQVGYIDLVNLEHSVDRAYRKGAAFMFNDSTLAFLKTLKDKYGRPLWVPGMTSNAPDTINGYPYFVNNDMATLAVTSPVTARKTVLFGQLKKYHIRKVKELVVMRLTERFADYGQVAFIGFARYDGNLIDAGTHPVKYLTNPAS